jgi:hypothetical protein
MNDARFVANSSSLLANWLAIDRQNVIRALLGVPYVQGVREWATNDFKTTVITLKQFMAWSESRQTVIDLAKALEPLLVNLGVHLQSQDDRAVYSLVSLLEWIDSLNLLGRMGKGLLDGIKRTQAAGLSPNQQPSG